MPAAGAELSFHDFAKAVSHNNAFAPRMNGSADEGHPLAIRGEFTTRRRALFHRFVMEPATTTTGLNAKLVITTPRGLETLGTMDVASEFDKSNAARPPEHSDGEFIIRNAEN